MYITKIGQAVLNLLSFGASPDPNPRGGGQLPNPNECNSTLTSETKGIYPHRYILMLMSGVTVYVFSTRGGGGGGGGGDIYLCFFSNGFCFSFVRPDGLQ